MPSSVEYFLTFLSFMELPVSDIDIYRIIVIWGCNSEPISVMKTCTTYPMTSATEW